MRKKVYSLLVESWRSFINESSGIKEALSELYATPGNWVIYEKERPQGL